MSDEKLYKKRLQSYIFGGLGALVLTLLSFSLVMSHTAAGFIGGVIVLILAMIQAGVQLFWFLHLGEEKSPRWKSFSFLFTAITVMIIVGGSVWVVSRMNYHMMLTPQQVNQYMEEQNKEGF